LISESESSRKDSSSIEKVPKRKKKNKDEEVLQKAIQKAQENLQNFQKAKYSQVAREFGIAKSTLHERVTKGIRVRGSIFTINEEEELIKFIRVEQKGNPFTKETFLDFVNEFIKVHDKISKMIMQKTNPTSELKLNLWWFRGFKK